MAPKPVPAEEAFIVTVGVPHDRRVRDAECHRALSTLRRAGFTVGATSGDALLELAKQEELNRELATNDPETPA